MQDGQTALSDVNAVGVGGGHGGAEVRSLLPVLVLKINDLGAGVL